MTDHAVERFRQRVAGRHGELDPRPEIVGRVTRAWEAGRVSATSPSAGGSRTGTGLGGGAGPVASRLPRGTVYVGDLVDRSVVFVCRHDRAGAELVVITLWEQEGGPAPPRVPRRFTDALRRKGP